MSAPLTKTQLSPSIDRVQAFTQRINNPHTLLASNPVESPHVHRILLVATLGALLLICISIIYPKCFYYLLFSGNFSPIDPSSAETYRRVGAAGLSTPVAIISSVILGSVKVNVLLVIDASFSAICRIHVLIEDCSHSVCDTKMDPHAVTSRQLGDR